MAQTPCSLGKTSAIVIILPFVSCLPRGIGLDYSRTPSLLPILLCFLLYIFSCRSSSLIFPINSCGVLLFLVPQSCPTLCNLMNCSLPGSSVHGILQSTGVGSHSLLQGIFLTQGSNMGFSHCRQILYHLSHQRTVSNNN